MTTEIAQVGDIIEWSFKDNENVPANLQGKVFHAKVSIVVQQEGYTFDKCYGVYAEYGQDYIPFSDATIIKRKQQ
jgi:hypothetical protein